MKPDDLFFGVRCETAALRCAARENIRNPLELWLGGGCDDVSLVIHQRGTLLDLASDVQDLADKVATLKERAITPDANANYPELAQTAALLVGALEQVIAVAWTYLRAAESLSAAAEKAFGDRARRVLASSCLQRIDQLGARVRQTISNPDLICVESLLIEFAGQNIVE